MLDAAIAEAKAKNMEAQKRTEEQARLSPAERRENCRRAFVSAPVTGDIILVDDVVTSGETLAAAASALKAAGARRVFAFALAHGRGDRLKIVFSNPQMSPKSGR